MSCISTIIRSAQESARRLADLPTRRRAFVIEGNLAAEYRELDGVPHLVGWVDQRDDGDLTSDRLAQVFAGEIGPRRAGFAALGASNLDDYQTRTADIDEFDFLRHFAKACSNDDLAASTAHPVSVTPRLVHRHATRLCLRLSRNRHRLGH